MSAPVIRPCRRCGGLISASALQCEACGHPVSGAPREGERVRSCLQCGVIIRFDQDPCPVCGASAREEGGDVERVKACPHCTEVLAFQELYCRHCGELALFLEEDEIPPVVELEGRAGWAERLADSLTALLVVAGVLALGHSLLLLAR